MGITRRSSRWIGYFVLLAGLGLSVLAEFRGLYVLISTGLLVFAGLSFVVAGFETRLTKRLGWHRLFALGFFAISLLQLLQVLFSGSSDSGVLYIVTTLSLAALFAFMGFDIARDGPHFDVDPDETI